MRSMPRRIGTALSVLLLAGGLALFAAARNGLGDPPPAPLPTATFAVPPEEVLEAVKAPSPDRDPVCRKPSEVTVPDLEVSALWHPVPIVNGWLAVPDDVTKVASVSGTDLADTDGTFLLAGHVDAWDQGAGAFYPLVNSRPGTIVTVTGPDCEITRWVVTGLHVVIKDALPAWIYAVNGPRRLALVTCGGPIIKTASGNQYRDNVIVEAVPLR